MKKILLLFLFLGTLSIYAQDVQLHYDLGKDRKYFTSTIEMFKPDKFGSTYFFIDMDYNVGDVKGVSMAYWEISRELKFWKTPLTWHVEYNGGFGQFISNDENHAFTINDAWLTGVAYEWNNSDFTKGFALQALYKYIRDKQNLSFQVTGVWQLFFFDKKLSLMGFADFWREDKDFNFDGTTDTKFIFLSEPQFWYNFTEHFSGGSEVELGNNFGSIKGFRVNPTVAVKYNF